MNLKFNYKYICALQKFIYIMAQINPVKLIYQMSSKSIE